MKKSIYLFIFITFLALNANAKVWRLNNSYGVNADFSSWTAAYNGTSAGDTIYVEGSQTNYGDVTLYKPLIIIGPGYFLNQNSQTQKTPYSATFNVITFQTGCTGSQIYGLNLNYCNIYCGGLTINNNDFNYITFYANNSYNNIMISKNYFGYINSNGSSVVNNIIINNNIIYPSNYNTSLSLASNYSGLISNNTIILTNYAVTNVNVYGFIFTNNIIWGNVISNGGYNTFSYNICNGTQLPVGNNNQLNVDMSTVFVGGGSYDGSYQLKAGSPAIGAGTNGTDIGAFGGTDPYVLSGLPGIPAVYEITTSGQGSTNTGLNVNVKAKTH